MRDRCPSELSLEAHLIDPARSPAPGHIAGCTVCLGRLQGMKAESEQFRRFVYPRTVGKVIEQNAKPKSALRWLLAVPVAAVLVGAAIYGVRAAGLWQPGEEGAPGRHLVLAFSVFAGEGGPALPADAPVPASASLTFRVHPTAACRLWVVSTFAGGQVERRFPAAGDEGAPIAAGPLLLPVEAHLDGRPGPERLYAVCTKAALPFSQLEAAVRDEVKTDEAGLRAGRVPLKLPEDAPQATLLIEKRTRAP